MGGRWQLKLESVIVVESQNNYGRFLRAFHLFDAMLSGFGRKATKKDFRIVRGAVSEFLGIESNGYHSFVNDTFRHFCKRKTLVSLGLHQLKNEDFVSLVMNEVKEREYSEVSDDDVNLFKPVVFELFGNVQEMVITAEYKYGGVFAFNLERLLQHTFPKSPRPIADYCTSRTDLLRAGY
jgi:hypothetical protein